MTQPWSMARVASRRQLPKARKMHGPVGHDGYPRGYTVAGTIDNHCLTCGYYVCICEPLMDNGPIDPIVLPQIDWGRCR